MLPGGAMSELIGRIGALQLITKDQIMNLAVELLPPARVRELMSHLGVLVGFQEWDQIRHRRDWGPDYGLPHNSKAGWRGRRGGGAESSSDGPRQPGEGDLFDLLRLPLLVNSIEDKFPGGGRAVSYYLL